MDLAGRSSAAQARVALQKISGKMIGSLMSVAKRFGELLFSLNHEEGNSLPGELEIHLRLARFQVEVLRFTERGKLSGLF